MEVSNQTYLHVILLPHRRENIPFLCDVFILRQYEHMALAAICSTGNKLSIRLLYILKNYRHSNKCVLYIHMSVDR